MAEKTKYLWNNNHPQNDQNVYVYYNERGEEIYGNTVTESNVECPYSKHSIYKNPRCVGVAHRFVKKNPVGGEIIGLTDINLIEYEKLKELWGGKNNNN
tara:strand:+ start:231 stop:527 length:297 start_codon:yes stop_codon:yes gene_type:complete